MKRYKKLFESKDTWYHASITPIKKFDISKAKYGGAFGQGIYFSSMREDALSWVQSYNENYLIHVEITKPYLRAVESDKNTIEKFKDYINIEYYLKKDYTVNTELWLALEMKYGEKAKDVLQKIGFCGMEHGSAREAYRGKATNLVIFDDKAIRVKKVEKI